MFGWASGVATASREVSAFKLEREELASTPCERGIERRVDSSLRSFLIGVWASRVRGTAVCGATDCAFCKAFQIDQLQS